MEQEKRVWRPSTRPYRDTLTNESAGYMEWLRNDNRTATEILNQEYLSDPVDGPHIRKCRAGGVPDEETLDFLIEWS